MLNAGTVRLSARVTSVIYPPSIDPAASSSTPIIATDPNTQISAQNPRQPGLQAALGDRENLHTLGQKLSEVATRLGVNARPQAVLAALQTTPMQIRADSSFPAQANKAATLETFLRSIGLGLPTNHFQLTGHAHAVSDRALEHPLGNFGGGLSWPVPMSAGQLRRVLAAATDHGSQNPNAPHIGASVGVLEYLNANQPLSGEALTDPAKALETLVSSTRGQALGQAIQDQLGGVATHASVNEYALSAIHLLLDPESITAPHRNRVAGFDLAQQAHWGRPASAVLERLSTYLHENHKTSPEMAKAGAYLLLARKAPEFLIKDIPDRVTYGSPAWVSLTVAAAAIEAQFPGKVAHMTFAQVMSSAENAMVTNRAATEHAQKAALVDWGVVNGIVTEQQSDHYSAAEIDTVRTAFNAQLKSTLAATGLLETAIPSRRDIALAHLKERFGEGVPFEEKLLKVVDSKQSSVQPLYDPNRAPAGHFSLLDIAMSGLGHYKWESKDPRVVAAIRGKSLDFGVNEIFNGQFEQAITSRKQGVGTTIKHLVATLPLADREKLEFGKLEFFQKNTYELGLDFTSKKLQGTESKLWVKASRKDDDTVYEIDLKAGAIKAVPLTELTRQRAREANKVFKTERFTPKAVSDAALSQKTQDHSSTPPASFSSVRTQSIADAFVEHLDLDSDEVKTYAKGVTAFDKQMATEWNVTNFFLDLIPLRSAIVNFSKGNPVEGASDLALDVFGFVTAGAGVAAKVTKVGAKVASTAAKALQVAKVIGVAAVQALNPLDGVGDLVAGGARLLGKGASFVRSTGAEAVNKLKGASGSYELLKAASKHYDAAATGTFKVAGQNVDGGAVLHSGRWYAFDVDRMRAYGSPLEGFIPKTSAMDGAIITTPIDPGSALNNRLFGDYKVPESKIAGLARNSQGIYVAPEGHLSHIRHTDTAGNTAVYEVRQVTRTADGAVQAQIYHNNRQTPVLVQHLQGDQWQRLGARGGNGPTVASDLGPRIGGGGEGVIYESLDGKSVYKDYGPSSLTPPAGYADNETLCLNNYYGEGFAATMYENGRRYLKMGKIDGADLSKFSKGSLPPEASSLLDDVFREMEQKNIYHNDLQLKNFMYSAKDNKIYPVDLNALEREDLGAILFNMYKRSKEELRKAYETLIVKPS
ncbi:hypothetical protein AU074_23680 [Pseudomonas sp. ATCC PTA-122608]|uniref:OspG family effector kinase n=1 Tax=Pseudomonas sp. ATCC PTA-122608 TaxID=1771311 RepID=UPI00096BABDE|nr:hypothetical protein [Pseudomonas sp. ATCC PTA-122608]OLY75487.1 hypothetical protein AU074_23680 [Pseudomonas sp. ATCC PTA-122608]